MSHFSQAQENDYALNSLGWKAFQDLCITIVSDVLSQTVEKFGPTKDGGRDGAFQGAWRSTDGVGVNGSFTVQCKFSARQNTALSISDLKDELKKAQRLASNGFADNYILMTNCNLSGTSEERIRTAFLAIPEIRCILIFGSEWITQKIRENKRLRMLVPRVYGLGDLSQILDERAYTQAQEILNAMRENIAKIVITEAYRRSANALVNRGFVLLLGEPASGKSTIAASLSLGALDLWGCSTIIIRTPDDFQRHWNTDEPHQFFWVDDVFGTTQYQRESAYEWNKTFPYMLAAIRKGTRVLFTSRDYIYRAALLDLKTSEFPLIKDSQVVINVQGLTKDEKEQILYNHIKLGDQDVLFRQQIKPYLPLVANSAQFLPEIARRLGSRLFTKNLSIDRNSIVEFVEKPLSFLVEVIRTLDRGSLAALSLIFMRGGLLESPISLTTDDERALRVLGATLATVREGLNNMEGSLTKLVRSDGISLWAFKHPTIGDALGTIIASDPELLDIYLAGTGTDKQLNEVTCGDLKYPGVRVIVPISRYNDFIGRLDLVADRRRILNFLSSRCDRDFLEKYLLKHVNLYQEVCHPTPYLGTSAETGLVARLHEYGILPEDWRLVFVSTVEELAVDIPDSDFLNIASIRRILKEQEIINILTKVSTALIPRLESAISDWESNYNHVITPEAYYEPLKSALHDFRTEFLRLGFRVDLIDDAEPLIDRSISGLWDEYQEPDYEREDENFMEPEGVGTPRIEPRSIFDDVDEV